MKFGLIFSFVDLRGRRGERRQVKKEKERKVNLCDQLRSIELGNNTSHNLKEGVNKERGKERKGRRGKEEGGERGEEENLVGNGREDTLSILGAEGGQHLN